MARKYALGYVTTDGMLHTENVNWKPNTMGWLDLAHGHLNELASIIGGDIRKGSKASSQWYVVDKNGQPPRVAELLSRGDDWLSAISSDTSKPAETIENR